MDEKLSLIMDRNMLSRIKTLTIMKRRKKKGDRGLLEVIPRKSNLPSIMAKLVSTDRINVENWNISRSRIMWKN